MNKKQMIITLLLVIALGVTFETFKKVKIDSSKGEGMNQVLSAMEVTPFVQRQNGRSAVESQRARSRNMKPKKDPLAELQKLADNQKGQLALGDSPKKDKKAKKAKKKKDAKEGEEKEKKAEDETETAEKDTEKNEEPKENPDSDEETQDNQNTEYAGGVLPGENDPADETPPLDEVIAEWANELLKTPDYKLLNEFISLKQTGRIPDEAFYLVVQMLLDDSRESMKLMGAFALGSTPSLRSFDLLIVTGQNAPFGSKLSQAVARHKNGYMGLNQMETLKNVLYSSENLESLRTAADLVKQAASRYLENSVVASSVTAQRQGDTVGTKSKTIFAGLKSILRSLADSSTDEGIVASAAQALSTIEQYIPDESDSNSEEEIASSTI